MNRCKYHKVKILSDGTKAYTCKKCKKLRNCKKEEGKTARAILAAIKDFGG